MCIRDRDTTAPGLDFFYVRTNDDGTLYIDNLYSQYNLANQENALDTSVQSLIGQFESESDVVELQSEVQTRYDEALAADAVSYTHLDVYKRQHTADPADRTGHQPGAVDGGGFGACV